METKHLVFLLALLIGCPVGVTLATRYPRLRDACAFALLLGTTRYDLQAINFMTREWYRGTTRGFEVCWLDFVWIILLTAEARARRPGTRSVWPASLLCMLVFFAYNALNVALSTPYLFGLFELSKMLRAIMVFLTVAVYVKSERELRILVWAMCASVAYEWWSAIYVRVALGHTRAEGTLSHPNSLSMYNLISAPVLLAVSLSDADLRLRRACALASLLGVISVLFTVSRNGLVTMGLLLAAVGLTCGSLRITAKKAAKAACVAVLGAAVLSKTWGAFEARFATDGGYEKEYEGKVYEGRGVYLTLAEFMVADNPSGCGLNNWSWCVSAHYGPKVSQHYVPYPSVDRPPPRRIRLRPNAHVDDPHAPPGHSLYAITLGETGWPGVIAYALLWARWLHMGGVFLFRRSPDFLSRFGTGAFFGLVGAFAQSFTEWEIRQTPLLFLLHILLGAVAAILPARPSVRR